MKNYGYGTEIKFKDEEGNLLIDELVSSLKEANYFTLDEKVYDKEGKIIGFRSWSCKIADIKKEEDKIIVDCSIKYTTIYSLEQNIFQVIYKENGILDLYPLLSKKDEESNTKYTLYSIDSIVFENEIETNSNSLKLRNIKNIQNLKISGINM